MANQNHGQGNKGNDQAKPATQNFASMGDGKQREAATRTGQAVDEDGKAVVGKGDEAGTDKRAGQDGKDASANRSDK